MRGIWMAGVLSGIVAGLAMGGRAGRGSPEAATQGSSPGTAMTWWEKQPGWAKEVNGLRVQLTGSGWMAPGRGLQAQVAFWNITEGKLAFAPEDPEAFAWEVRDGAGKVVKGAAAPAAPVQEVRWWTFGSGQSSPGLIVVREEEGRNGELRVGGNVWKLSPGKYTLRGTFSGPSEEPGRPMEPATWWGKVELAPLAIEVFGKVSREDLLARAAVVQSMPWVEEGVKFRALTGLVTPGMTMEDLQAVLPRVEGADGSLGSIGGSGDAVFMEYPVSKKYRVKCQGFGAFRQVGPAGVMLSSWPEIVVAGEKGTK